MTTGDGRAGEGGCTEMADDDDNKSVTSNTSHRRARRREKTGDKAVVSRDASTESRAR